MLQNNPKDGGMGGDINQTNLVIILTIILNGGREYWIQYTIPCFIYDWNVNNKKILRKIQNKSGEN